MNTIKKPVVNFDKGRGGQNPLLIVIHIVGEPGKTAESAYNWFNNPASKVSAHAVVLRDGTIWELVKDEDTSYGTGAVGHKNGVPIPPVNAIANAYWKKGINLNQIALNLEHEGAESEDITPAQYIASAEWVKEKCQKFNIPIDNKHIDKHSNIRLDKTCPGKISVDYIITQANLIHDDSYTSDPLEEQKKSLLQMIIDIYTKIINQLKLRK